MKHGFLRYLVRPRAPSFASAASRAPRGGVTDPLHGITLAKMMDELVAHHGWDGLAKLVPVRCFQYDPSIKSSLTFLRRTPWARDKVEALYREFVRKRDGLAG